MHTESFKVTPLPTERHRFHGTDDNHKTNLSTVTAIPPKTSPILSASHHTSHPVPGTPLTALQSCAGV